MKIKYPVCIILILLLIVAGCSKKGSTDEPQVNPCFDVQAVYKSFFSNHGDIPTTFTDSAFSFINCTDAYDTFTYKWDFGDGHTSTEGKPIHRYTVRGIYPVTLVVFLDGQPIDSIIKPVRVIMGQKNLAMSGNYDTPVDIASTEDGGFLILVKKQMDEGYYLFKTDSLLQEKSKIDFPSQSFNLASLKRLKDGNYILAGTTSGAKERFGITKISGSGSILWTNTYSNAESACSYVDEAADGGLISIGREKYPYEADYLSERILVVSTDPDGRLRWRKEFSDGRRTSGAKDIIAETDGFVFASNKISETALFFDEDSMQIVKLATNDGSVVWRNTRLWGFSYYTGDTRIKKVQDGYAVVNVNSTAVIRFDKNGMFRHHRLFSPYGYAKAIDAAANGGMLLLRETSGNGFFVEITGIDVQGNQRWSYGINGSQYFADGSYSCCSNSAPVASLPLKDGGHIILARRVDDDDTILNGLRAKIVLLEIDDNGLWK